MSGDNGTIYHAICVAKDPENHTYYESKLGDKDSFPHISPNGYYHREEIPLVNRHENYNLGCETRHRYYRAHFPDGLRTAQERYNMTLDLSVLRVCRQIYEEGTTILWRTNTFSFEVGQSLEAFLVKLNSMQRRKLSKLHIRATYLPETMAQWRKTLRTSIIDSLQELRSLHICFDYDVGLNSYLRLVFNDNSFEVHERLSSPYSRLLVLPLHRATVIFKDN